MASIGKRLLDMARSNLNALLDRAAETADPRRKLSDVSDEELTAELERRKTARDDKERLAQAKAQAGGGAAASGPPKDRADRERIAREREAKVRAAREARERAEKAVREAQEKARAAQRPRPGPSASAPGRKDPVLAKHYEVLEVPYGADWDTVKSAYRKLMRKYHPDLHHKTPEKQKAATEVSTALTVAYNELEKHLTKK